MSAVLPAPTPRRRGRPPCCPRELAIRIIRLRRQGLSYGAISAVLNAEGVPTPTGRPRWHKAYVDRLLHTRYVKELIEEIGDR
jgi:hypothetical protein